MEYELQVNGFPTPMEWKGAPSLKVDDQGDWRTDRILDFGYWCAGGNITIAGKPDAPDPAAMDMAAKVLGDLGAAFAKFKMQYKKFKLSRAMVENDDEWVLEALCFPYQTLDSCWFATFDSEYGATQDFCFWQPECATEFVIDAYEAGGWASKISSVRYCVQELQPICMGDKDLAVLIERISCERLVGPELVEPLLRILAKETLGVEESKVQQFRKSLTSDAETYRREEEARQREQKRKAQEVLKRGA